MYYILLYCLKVWEATVSFPYQIFLELWRQGRGEGVLGRCRSPGMLAESLRRCCFCAGCGRYIKQFCDPAVSYLPTDKPNPPHRNIKGFRLHTCKFPGIVLSGFPLKADTTRLVIKLPLIYVHLPRRLLIHQN